MQGCGTPCHSGPTTAEGKDVLTAPQNPPGKALCHEKLEWDGEVKNEGVLISWLAPNTSLGFSFLKCSGFFGNPAQTNILTEQEN